MAGLAVFAALAFATIAGERGSRRKWRDQVIG
jgi:hypothetical protein